jgi:hypothetical protein
MTKEWEEQGVDSKELLDLPTPRRDGVWWGHVGSPKPATAHAFGLRLNVLTNQLRGTVTAEMLAANDAVLRTESVAVNLPHEDAMLPCQRPRPLGIVTLLFPVSVDLDWWAVVAVRLSLKGEEA